MQGLLGRDLKVEVINQKKMLKNEIYLFVIESSIAQSGRDN